MMLQRNNHVHYLDGRYTGTVHGCADEGIFFLSGHGRKQIGIDAGIDEIYTSIIKNIHEGAKNTAHQDRAIIREQYAGLRQAIREGYGKLSVEVEYGTPSQAMLRNLQYNISVFSAFKKHELMRELVKDLKDQDGNLKSYSDFRKDAFAKIGQYRESWLQVEYNTAVRSCRMAAVWEGIQRSKNIYPNIKYTISRSANKREDHLQLVGTILPVDHPFWNIHFPPNGFGCKCSAQPTDEKPTEIPAMPEVDPAFAFNPGKEGKVFEIDKHPYSQIPKRDYTQAVKEAWGALCAYERDHLLQTVKNSGLMKKKIPVNGLSAPVELNRASFENNLTYDTYFFDKLSLLQSIDEILKDSHLILTENRKLKQHVKQYHILQHTTLAGKRINLHVEERKTGECYLYHLHIQK